jgi:hypothetical protein
MKESKLLEMRDRILRLERTVKQLVKYAERTQIIAEGTLTVMKRLPDFDAVYKTILEEEEAKAQASIKKAEEEAAAKKDPAQLTIESPEAQVPEEERKQPKKLDLDI